MKTNINQPSTRRAFALKFAAPLAAAALVLFGALGFAQLTGGASASTTPEPVPSSHLQRERPDNGMDLRLRGERPATPEPTGPFPISDNRCAGQVASTAPLHPSHTECFYV